MARSMGLNEARDAGFNGATTPPNGEWTGELVGKAWGKAINLLCFFENLETGEIHRCVAFRSDDKRYTPRDKGIDFSEDGIEGEVFVLQTGVNSKGNPAWHSAARKQDVQEEASAPQEHGSER